MARLNDLPASTESVEALKRRFVRQNREIARANSIQSLRIQSLESEVARLLSENVSLRERVISLSQEVARFESARMLNDGVYDLKAKLDAKLAELGSLVVELGMLPRKVGRMYDSKRDNINREQEKSPGFNHRHPAIESEAGVNFDDGRLPVILEDKYYPRRTLEPHEFQDISEETSDVPDSPEVGPPSVARDAEKDLSPDPLPEPLEFEKSVETDVEQNDSPMSPNLETGKKRKNNSMSSDTCSAGVTEELSRSASESKHTLKPGSKRKFVSRDEDDEFLSDRNGADDDFRFIRPNHTPQKLLRECVPTSEDPPPNVGQADLKREFKNQAPARRKVLEPKSSNINPVSPKKHVATENEKVPREDGLNGTSADAVTKSPQYIDRIRDAKVTKNKLNQRENGDRNSESSAVDAISAPASTGESALSTESKNTSHQQSQDTSTTESNTLAVASRHTRRPRSVISYAEPNLKDKMRRSTNEFVDAVGEDRFRRAQNSRLFERTDARVELQATDTGKTKMKAGAVKAGDTTVPTSRTLPATDSTDKDSTSLKRDSFNCFSELPNSVITERKRRTLSANKDDLLLQSQGSGGPAYEDTSSTLTREGRRSSDPKRREGKEDSSIDIGPKKSDDSAGYASQNECDSHSLVRSSKSLNKDVSTARPSRRHSSNPNENQTSPRWSADSLQPRRFQTSSDMNQKQAERTDEISKNSSKSSHGVNQTEVHGNTMDGEGKSSSSRQKIAKEIAEISAAAATDAGQLKRGQRAASRRRSMML